MLDIIGIVILILLGIAILGPEKLPIGVEAISLNVVNLSRTHRGDEPFSLEEARVYWDETDSFINSIVALLRAAEEHLVELRGRIFKTVATIVVASVVSAIASDYILAFLVRPAGITLIFLRPTEMFGTYITVIVTTAIALAVPVIMYHVLAFVRPALENAQEEKIFRTVIYVAAPFSLIFFCGGVAFAYFVMLPFALKYLASFGSDIAQASWNISSYMSFVTNMLFWLGASFETPLIMFVLARTGIVSAQQFSSVRKYAYVAIAAAAAVITPTPDAFNMLLTMAPLTLLYEFGVLLAKLGGRASRRDASSD